MLKRFVFLSFVLNLLGATASQCTVVNSSQISIKEIDCSLTMNMHPFDMAAMHYYYRLNPYDQWRAFPQILLMERLNRQIWLQAIVAHNTTDSEALVLCDGNHIHSHVYISPRILYTYRSISLSHLWNPTCGAPWLAYIAISVGVLVGLLIICVCCVRCANTELQFEL